MKKEFKSDKCVEEKNSQLTKRVQTTQQSTEDNKKEHIQHVEMSKMNNTIQKQCSEKRTIYAGKLPPETTVTDLCDSISGGIIENVHIIEKKNCGFVTFVDAQDASVFFEMVSHNVNTVRGQQVSWGWGSSNLTNPDLQKEVQKGASRNVFIGGAKGVKINKMWLRNMMSRFGKIDCVDVVPSKNIAFVHFCSIKSALGAVRSLSKNPGWKQQRISYGSDRCVLNVKRRGVCNTLKSSANTKTQIGNRTLYLGSVSPEITATNICDSVNAGILEHVKLVRDKNCCFLSFIDVRCAALFFSKCQRNNGEFLVKGNALKVGWGTSRPLHPDIKAALIYKATRNVFFGDLDRCITEEILKRDLIKFGPIEKIRVIPSKHIAFVNFCSILHAINCVKELTDSRTPLWKVYGKFRINYGRDRCAAQSAPLFPISETDRNKDFLLNGNSNDLFSNGGNSNDFLSDNFLNDDFLNDDFLNDDFLNNFSTENSQNNLEISLNNLNLEQSNPSIFLPTPSWKMSTHIETPREKKIQKKYHSRAFSTEDNQIKGMHSQNDQMNCVYQNTGNSSNLDQMTQIKMHRNTYPLPFASIAPMQPVQYQNTFLHNTTLYHQNSAMQYPNVYLSQSQNDFSQYQNNSLQLQYMQCQDNMYGYQNKQLQFQGYPLQFQYQNTY